MTAKMTAMALCVLVLAAVLGSVLGQRTIETGVVTTTYTIDIAAGTMTFEVSVDHFQGGEEERGSIELNEATPRVFSWRLCIGVRRCSLHSNSVNSHHFPLASLSADVGRHHRLRFHWFLPDALQLPRRYVLAVFDAWYM